MKTVLASFDFESRCCKNEQIVTRKLDQISQLHGFAEAKKMVHDLRTKNSKYAQIEASIAELSHLLYTQSSSQSNSSLLLNIANKYCQKYSEESKIDQNNSSSDFYKNFVASVGKYITIDYNNLPKKTKKEIGKKIDKFHKLITCVNCQSTSRQYLLEL